MLNPTRHFTICNLFTLGIEQWEEIRRADAENETRETYRELNNTLDRLKDLGIDRFEAWDIICACGASLLERSYLS